ncbi:sensor histidine kinase [Roseibium sediminicola]|uniref:histidine kinase n=1 Tax=Roseibium sediminicola TaxID=2933272 RepID=A0ABT0GRN1_9HYPH|nr:sensor histidine kinase [Roseibium sp. CAU 1639]MCK7611712.1 sensor histidine kinase [Roseibium sp. CAU 1639]
MRKFRNKARSTGSLEADHRIANHLGLLSSYVRLKGIGLTRQESPLEAMEVALLLNAISAHIQAVSDLHRILAGSGSEDEVQLGDLLGQICTTLRSGIADDVIFTETYAPGCALKFDHVLPVAQIFTEIVTNALKYGHRAGAVRRIGIACRKDISGSILIMVNDNGPGLGSAGTSKTANGLGTRLVKALSAQIGSSIDYSSSESGVTATLTLASAGFVFDQTLTPDVSRTSFSSNG